ncbi:MAG TPA: hypothetical protein DCO79_11995 [Spirochaeta sp.]|nr:hypothetical protein [Spirochaeta sp.]
MNEMNGNNVILEGLDYTKRDFYIKIAKMYFIEELSQQEISEAIGVSRSNISKILKACRDLKIVEIRVNDTSSLGIMFQEEIKKLFDIENVIVIPSGKDEEHTKIQLGKISATLLDSMVEDNSIIGISRGSTLYHTVTQFSPKNYMGIEVVQIVGGTGDLNLSTDGHELARTIANKLNAGLSVLQAPLFLKSSELRDMLMKEPGISKVMKKAQKINIVLLGVGTNHEEDSAFIKAGYLTEDESRELLLKGAVGDLCGKQIDINGKKFDAELNNRFIGVDLDVLKKIPHRLCVAGGVHKAEVILGALRGGYINSLVTDEDAAMRILSLIKT